MITFTKNILLSLIITLSFSACSGNTITPPKVESITVEHEFIIHPDSIDKKIEFYWAKPLGKGPWPVIIYIHGHQESPRIGGQTYVDWGVLQKDAENGLISVAVSQPGYGGSSGPPDFCGPFTQNAVKTVISFFRKKDFVLPNKIALSGVSRGAVVASMIVTDDHQIAAAVLASGFYDFKDAVKKLKNNAAEILQDEMSINKQTFLERSAILHAKNIKTPLLILNGAQDDQTFPEQSKKLGKIVNKNGTFAKVIIYPNFGHSIPQDEKNKAITPFLEKYLR